MRIAIIVEGKTEKGFFPHLRSYLADQHACRPAIDCVPQHGRVPTGDKLRRMVEHLLHPGPRQAGHVIALTDVYTGTRPPDFTDAADAKNKMRQWVGSEPRFHPHAAQYDFEAWLLPYWKDIQRLAGHNKSAPGGNPEYVNHERPPARRIAEVFASGRCRKHYNKPRDAGRILRDNDLAVAIGHCAELKAFVNTILHVTGKPLIP
jgi:hypothetical protein